MGSVAEVLFLRRVSITRGAIRLQSGRVGNRHSSGHCFYAISLGPWIPKAEAQSLHSWLKLRLCIRNLTAARPCRETLHGVGSTNREAGSYATEALMRVCTKGVTWPTGCKQGDSCMSQSQYATPICSRDGMLAAGRKDATELERNSRPDLTTSAMLLKTLRKTSRLCCLFRFALRMSKPERWNAQGSACLSGGA